MERLNRHYPKLIVSIMEQSPHAHRMPVHHDRHMLDYQIPMYLDFFVIPTSSE